MKVTFTVTEISLQKKKKTSVNDCMIWRQSLEAGMFSTHKIQVVRMGQWQQGDFELHSDSKPELGGNGKKNTCVVFF